MIYAHSMNQSDRLNLISSTVEDIFACYPLEENIEGYQYIDLTVLFTELNSTCILSNTPPVRLFIKQDIPKPTEMAII